MLKLVIAAFTFCIIALTALRYTDRGQDLLRHWLDDSCSQGNLTRSKALIALGADVINGWSAQTPLHCAAYSGNIELVKYLISKGAIVDAGAKFGETPLNSAREHGHEEVVAYLVSMGANPNPNYNPP